MKASELITAIQEQIAIHGDIEVVVATRRDPERLNKLVPEQLRLWRDRRTWTELAYLRQGRQRPRDSGPLVTPSNSIL
jgi:hypothetical protein